MGHLNLDRNGEGLQEEVSHRVLLRALQEDLCRLNSPSPSLALPLYKALPAPCPGSSHTQLITAAHGGLQSFLVSE